MPSLSLRVPPDLVRAAVHRRLYAGAQARGAVLWTDRGDAMLLHPDTLRLDWRPGWMLATLEAETDQTGRTPVQVPFRVGLAGRTDGVRVATTLDVPGDSGLLARWGAALHTAVWDGLLDALQGAVDAATSGRGAWSVAGVSCAEDGLHATLRAPEVAS